MKKAFVYRKDIRQDYFAKQDFHRDAIQIVRAIGKVLSGRGWWIDSVRSRKGGDAVSGDVTGRFFLPGSVFGAQVFISGDFTPGTAKSTSPSGVQIMYRAIELTIGQGGFENQWDAPWDETVMGMADRLERIAKATEACEGAKTTAA